MDLNGEKIGEYKLKKLLGKGGMGDVYIAHHQDFPDVKVAIKVLKPEHSGMMTEKRFKNGVKLIKELSYCENIVKWKGSGYDEKTKCSYLIMEYIEGKNLAEYVENNGCLKWSRQPHSNSPVSCLEIIRDMTIALKEAHTKGIVHRDIKPANILIEGNSKRAVLTDFDIAKEQGGFGKGRITPLTQVGSFAPRTPDYASPEQNRGEDVDGRSDIYSLGLVIYEMLASKFLSQSERINSLRLSKEEKSNWPLDAETIKKCEAPSFINKVLQKCLAEDKNCRYKNIDDLLKECIETDTVGDQRPIQKKVGFRYKAVVFAISILFIIVFSTLFLSQDKASVFFDLKPPQDMPQPAELELFIDGQYTTKSFPASVQISQQVHTFEILADGIRIWRDSVNVKSKNDTLIPPIFGKLLVESEEKNSHVYLNNSLFSSTLPIEIDNLFPGGHSIRIESKAGKLDTLIRISPATSKTLSFLKTNDDIHLSLTFSPAQADSILMKNAKLNTVEHWNFPLSPLTQSIRPQSYYKFAIYKDGYLTWEKEIRAGFEKNLNIRADLIRLGYVKFIVFPPPALVELDKKSIEIPAGKILEMQPGKHEIKILNQDGGYVAVPINLAQGDTLQVSKEFKEKGLLVVQCYDKNGNRIEGYKIYINGKTAPNWISPFTHKLCEGSYEIGIGSEQGIELSQLVEVDPKSPEIVKFTF